VLQPLSLDRDRGRLCRSWRQRDSGLQPESFAPPLTPAPRRFRESGRASHRENTMDNRTEGAGHQIKGAVKEQVGKATHDRSQQVAGNVEKHAGKAERMIAEINDRKDRKDTQR
jgi:uncharacterized protein YjbJ (UPF0337 family)